MLVGQDTKRVSPEILVETLIQSHYSPFVEVERSAMLEMLKPGQMLNMQQSGQKCRVEKLLGSGGQGEVYKAEWAGAPFALKWYYPHTATPGQLAILEKLVKVKEYSAPSQAFLWPLDLATDPNGTGFGYIMRLREPRFKNLIDLMTDRIDPSFRELVTVGLGLADSFYRLHMKGLCYRDISFGNAFFDPATGEVLICDNDNVAENRAANAGVLGTPDFMAPEIVRGEAMPSRQTDLFSLSVLLFYIFHISHPLVGRRVLNIRSWDLPARTKLFGAEPLFIFDPVDLSNEAVDKSVDPLGEGGCNALKYWQIYPRFFRDTFTKAFTDGLRDPEHGRVSEREWRRVLSQLRDGIFYCPKCDKGGRENFYDPETVKEKGATHVPCWHCDNEIRLPFRIRIGKSIVMLTHLGEIYPHHLDESKDFDFTAPIGKVIQHPADPNIWGLRNCMPEKWIATMPDGSWKEVQPGKSIALMPNLKVNFGGVEGEIR